jgi:coiled-coil domain-containing protein 130
MGVRYNAEKSKIGMYYTTPIFKFRMKCHLCNNHFEIKTDPAVSRLFNKYTDWITKLVCYKFIVYKISYVMLSVCVRAQNHDYVIISGARRKEQRWDPTENGQIVPEGRYLYD